MTDVSLSHLLIHPERIGVTFAAPAFLLLLLPGLWFVWRARTRLERLAASFRAAALLLLGLGLAGAALSTALPEQRSTWIAAVDLSESIDPAQRDWSLRFVNEMAAALPPGDELGVITFAGDSRIVRPPGPPTALSELPMPLSRTATDIGRGLDAALSLLPPDTAHRVILVSDGNETRGSARAKLRRAQRTRTAVYTAAPPPSGVVDVAVEKLAVSAVVAEGAVFPVRVVVRNSHVARAANLALSLDGDVIGREAVTLQPGLNTIEIPYRLSGNGSHRVRVDVDAADDAIAGNNYRETPVMLAGRPRVLLLTTDESSPLAAALGRKEVEVVMRAPAAAPTDPEDLLSYHCVIADRAVGRDLGANAIAAIERYVRDFGGGFVFAGGRSSFGDPSFKRTALQRLLPLTLESQQAPPRERDPLALILVIDRSNSMGYVAYGAAEGAVPQRDPQTSKLHYAKAAALAVIDQLKDHDQVGVIAFDSRSFPIAPLRALSANREVLRTLIPQLVENGGTDFYEALDSAREQLAASAVSRRHVILLTDGDTNRNPADHIPLIAALAQAGISVTTIRIGEDIVNLSLLNNISSQTNGSFYHVENPAMLPQLLLRDANAAMSQSASGDLEIAARANPSTQLLRGITRDFPPLRGYAFAKTKPGADVPLAADGRATPEPLLAAWQFGLGRVAAFTADPVDDADRWVTWSGFSKFWSQVVRWTMREQTPREYAFEARRRDDVVTLGVRAFDREQEGVLLARVHVSDDRVEDIVLAPVAPQRYEGELPPIPGGLYPVTVISRRGARDVIQRTSMVSFPSRNEEPQEEYQTTSVNRGLLDLIARETGGVFNPTTRDLASSEISERRLTYPLDHLLIPLAILCILADVAIRRLAIGDAA